MGKQPVNVQTASSRAVVSTAQPAVPTDAAGALGTRQVSAVPWEADVEGRQEGQAGVPELTWPLPFKSFVENGLDL